MLGIIALLLFAVCCIMNSGTAAVVAVQGAGSPRGLDDIERKMVSSPRRRSSRRPLRIFPVPSSSFEFLIAADKII